MDFFVCGNYASITCSTWIGLWSGAIGALVAAFVGGMVALMVVRLTNKHQSKLAAQGRVLVALADFQSAVSELPRRYTDGREAIQRLVVQADAASNRITMDIDDFELGEELSLWPLELGVLAVRAGDLHNDDYLEEADQGWRQLRESIGKLIGTTQQWARLPADRRREWPSLLRKERERLKVVAEELLG